MYTNVSPRPLSHYKSFAPIRVNDHVGLKGFIFSDMHKLVSKVNYDYQSNVITYQNVSLTSKEIVENPLVLPYNILPSFKKHSKFVEYVLELTQHDYFDNYIPVLYRIRDDLIADELGRIFRYDTFEHAWKFVKVSIGYDGRATKSFFGETKPVYYWTGIAGLKEQVQIKVMSLPSMEVHHINENKFDIRPRSLVPIPSWLHHDVVHHIVDPVHWYRWFNSGVRAWSKANIGYYVN